METSPRVHRESEYVARAAWLHFVGGLTQSEVARRLSISSSRAHRHIARAQASGLVRVFVDARAESCMAVESTLMRRFNLARCHVAMEVPEEGSLPLVALGVTGADFLMQAIASDRHRVIGVGNGRTIAAAVNAMVRMHAPGVRFVSMLGGLTRSFAANPYDVIHRLARKTDAEAYLMPAPLYADTPEDKQMMMAQSAIATTMDLMAQASLMVVGVGNLDHVAGATPTTAVRGKREIHELRGAGARAEIIGQFLDASGAIMKTRHDACAMAPALETLRGRDIVAMAGGAGKSEAVLAALRSGLLTGLITDEATARRIVDDSQADEPTAERQD